MIMIMMMMNMLLISKFEGVFEDDDFTPWGVKQLFPYAFWFETPRTMPASSTDLNIMIEIIIVMTLMIMVMIITITFTITIMMLSILMMTRSLMYLMMNITSKNLTMAKKLRSRQNTQL